MGLLVPLVNGVVVDQDWLDLDGAQKTVVDAGTVVDIEGDERGSRGHVAGDE
jgi:hypothetical protein